MVAKALFVFSLLSMLQILQKYLFDLLSHWGRVTIIASENAGLILDILKMESWTHMGHTANMIIK